ncbi:conserved Plasmodium protein, unknown function [Plasmodium chabaudi chabaudi]|uniref:Uncharacterized protein n=1 Tax=Plasmodium chabaudi chabaudi TaxID=31271 RepID=A0A4V0K1S2_PLACU|nr:conserved Plasmodium protein, unknown function [Plasmodium chabaudi chabaudi]VTZ66204.1 conserved Plasmodium protein, unknown function [Plasmodium chabaudi chabaudi]|eukprot:XP_016652969.1 conserved Plasmodium protein, unknown function [Plasmodium chabaudi chabaudi]
MENVIISNSNNVNFDKPETIGNMKLNDDDNNKIIIDEINKTSLYYKNANTSTQIQENTENKKSSDNDKEQNILNTDFNNDNPKDAENNIINSQQDNDDAKNKIPLNKKKSNYSEEKKKQTSLLNNNKNNSKLVKLKSENDNIDLKKSESIKYKTSLKANCPNNVKNKINNENVGNNYCNTDDITDKKKVHLNEQASIHNKKGNKDLSSSISKHDDVEINKEDILFQYEKCLSRKRKEKKKLKMKSKLFRKSVMYSKYSGRDVLSVVNQMKLNLRFYQREMDDFLSVIWNLQNMVLIEREKYRELKDMLKYTTEEIEKENNKLYDELNLFKQKYSNLKSVISNIGYGMFLNIEKPEVNNYKHSIKGNNSFIQSEKLYTDDIHEENDEGDYVMINEPMSKASDCYSNYHSTRGGRTRKNSSLLKYLDF